MPENTKLSNYLFYMGYLNRKLEGFFENQSPYIFCKNGCSKCCQNGEYPFSKAEFDYLMVGFYNCQLIFKKKLKLKLRK